jgi:hypothetical protein
MDERVRHAFKHGARQSLGAHGPNTTRYAAHKSSTTYPREAYRPSLILLQPDSTDEAA